MRKQFTVAAVILALSCVVPCRSWTEGLHNGEVDKLQVSVEFLNPLGYTTTHPDGIRYHYYGMVAYEPKIYPVSTYGKKYPLYFIGGTMGFRVTVSNTAPKGGKPFKVRVNAVNYVLETTGFSGGMIAPGQDWIVDSLKPGETRVVTGSIVIPADTDLPSGLDVTKVRVFHLNNGENDNAGFIKEETATWCPPPAE
jgi:hypothetical protein